jgi:hypothetical protein
MAPDEAFMADEAAAFAEDAASIAEVAADEAAVDAESVDGVVTTVVEVDGVVAAGVVVVVVVSSFLLHAANETAAARVTISNAVFMFLLDFKFGQSPVIVGTLCSKSPSICKTRKPRAFPVPNPRL